MRDSRAVRIGAPLVLWPAAFCGWPILLWPGVFERLQRDLARAQDLVRPRERFALRVAAYGAALAIPWVAAGGGRETPERAVNVLGFWVAYLALFLCRPVRRESLFLLMLMVVWLAVGIVLPAVRMD